MSRSRGLRGAAIIAVLALLALVGLDRLSGTGATASAASLAQRSGMRVLVTTDSSDPAAAAGIAYGDWANKLRREGVPFDSVLTDGANPRSIALPALSSTLPDGTEVANYEGRRRRDLGHRGPQQCPVDGAAALRAASLGAPGHRLFVPSGAREAEDLDQPGPRSGAGHARHARHQDVTLPGTVAHSCYGDGMARVRVSTTVDEQLLADARRMRSELPDAALLDEALASLLARHRTAELDAAYVAYDEHPLDSPDAWGDLASFRASAGDS